MFASHLQHLQGRYGSHGWWDGPMNAVSTKISVNKDLNHHQNNINMFRNASRTRGEF